MEVRITQVEGVKFEVQARSHTVVCDQPPGQWRQRFRNDTPPEFLLASLGACAAFYAAEYLRTRNLASRGVSASVAAEKLKAPARLGNFRVHVGSPVCLSPEQQEGLMRSVERCLVKNTLLNPPQIDVSIEVPSPIDADI